MHFFITFVENKIYKIIIIFEYILPDSSHFWNLKNYIISNHIIVKYYQGEKQFKRVWGQVLKRYMMNLRIKACGSTNLNENEYYVFFQYLQVGISSCMCSFRCCWHIKVSTCSIEIFSLLINMSVMKSVNNNGESRKEPIRHKWH